MVVIELFAQASFIVKMVMIFLLLMSVYSWSIIISKLKVLKKRTDEINYIKNVIGTNKNALPEWSKLARENGYFTEIVKNSCDLLFSQKKILKTDISDKLSFMKDKMELAIDKETQELKKNTAILATVGSVSPYIGLFGTVWGIMNSFIAIGQAKQATLEYVAPGIAEALVATAIGLFAAIPAYIFFNLISNKIEEISEDYDLMKDDFCLTAKESIEKMIDDNEK
jgi:biopolymer transport protein TolQ